MIAITLFGSPAWLVPYGPNTDDDTVTVKARIEVDAQRSLNGMSTRRAQARNLRIDQAWICQMISVDFYAARTAFLTAQDEPIAVPFWPAAQPVANSTLVTAGVTIAWKRGWTSYAINPGSLTGYDYYAPLLVGYFDQPPALTSQNSDYIRAEFSFVDQGPSAAAVTPPAVSDAALNTPDGFAAAIFPFTPEGSTAPKLTFGQVDVERQSLGPGRQPSDIFYPQTRETVSQPAFKFKTAAKAIALLGWWFRRGGGADPLWLATTQKFADLVGDVAIGQANITVTPGPGLDNGDTLALLTTGQPPELLRVTGYTDYPGPSRLYTVAPNAAAAHPALWTIATPAILCRHTDAVLELDFRRANADWVAETTLAFRECAAEYTIAAGETRGTTIGRLPGAAWFFRIDLDYGGVLSSWYVTNYESGATTPDAQVWEYHDCDFDKIVSSIDLSDDECNFSIRWWDAGPWANWLPGQLAARGFLTISRCDVNNAGALANFRQVWTGEMYTPTLDGPIIKVKVLGANAIFGRRAPKQLTSMTCGTNLFSPRCGLVQSQWTFAATIQGPFGAYLTVDALSWPQGALPPVLADYFALGYIQWTDGAGHPQRAGVLTNNELHGAGLIDLTVDRLPALAGGTAVTLIAGCDRQYTTCQNKFSNGANFRGFPFMPAISPSFIIPQTTSNPAKK